MYHMYVCVSESESEREELNCILGHSKKRKEKKKGGGGHWCKFWNWCN